MSDANRDENHVPVALGQSSTSATTTLPFLIDSATGRLLVDVAGGSGDVVGPASATDNAVVLFDGATGKLIKNSTIKLVTTVFSPTVSDGVALGSGSLMWSDLFLASGSVINWNNGDLTLTHSSNTLTLAGGDLALGANNITMTGSLGATGARLTAGFFTDLTVTNAISGSITGTAAIATTVTVADEATDTSCFINFTTAATGNLGIKTNTNMTFNSNTGVVTLASSILTTTDINGGTIDGTTIGASSATTIIGTTIQANTGFLPDTDGGAYLGQATQAFSGLFLDTGATINFDNSNVVMTHTAGILTMGTGEFRITTPGTNSASVPTLGSTSTLTNKTLTSPTINTATLGGTSIFAEGGAIAYDAASSADGVYTGFVRAGTAGTTLAFGDLVYLAAADSRWELADADGATTADRFLGMCVLAAAADGDPTTILLSGFIRADAAFPAMTIGSAMYVGETAGDIQTTIPTGADNIIRRVGYAWTADELYFNPSMDSQVTVA